MNRNKRLYRIWAGMKQRCNNPNNPSARWYQKKGIRLCGSWEKDFFSFQEWSMRNGYFEGASIDRIDSDKGYSPENCRWVTLDENRIRALRKRWENGTDTHKGRTILPKTMEGRIVELINRIAAKKGEDYAAGLVDGINLVAPRQETREETLAKISFYIQRMEDSQLRLLAAFARGLTKKSEEDNQPG